MTAAATAATFREARADDARWLTDFGRRVFEVTFGPHNSAADMAAYLDKHYTVERQATEIARPGSKIWIAEVDGKLVGYAQLLLDAPRPELDGLAATEVNRFYVDPALHGRGIAAAMMSRLMDESRAIGARWIWLAVWSENPRAIAFYRKVGFEKIGEQVFVLGSDRQTDWVLGLDLARPASTRRRVTSERRRRGEGDR